MGAELDTSAANWGMRSAERVLAHLPKVNVVLSVGAFVVAYYFAYRFGMSFSRTAASPFWFPDSVLLCALLMSRARHWWIFVLATLPIRVFSEVAQNIPLWFLATTFVLDSAKGVISAIVARRFVSNPMRLSTVSEFCAFFAFVVLLIPAVSAFGGAAARSLMGDDYWLAWEQWLMGDALAQLVVTPAILYWVMAPHWDVKALGARRSIEAGLLVCALVVTGYVASNTGAGSFAEARFYAPVPFLFWAAIRFGMFGASGAVTIIAICAITAALGGHGPFAADLPAGTASALQNYLFLRAAPLYLVAILIEQKQRVAEFLSESEKRFRNIANTAPVLLWMSKPDGEHEFVNQGWLEFAGRPLSDELGMGWIAGLHPEDRQPFLDAYRSAAHSQSEFQAEFRLRRHDGAFRWIHLRGVPRYAPSDKFNGYVGSATDITEQKRAEEGNRLLAQMQRLATVGELTAAISHEVRQPLSAILKNSATAAVLLKHVDPPLHVLRKIVMDIRDDNARVNEIISRIQSFSRKQEFNPGPFDLNSAVTDVFVLLAAELTARGVQIHAALAADLPLARGDSAQLQQVLLNLIVNGCDAMANTHAPSRHMIVATRLNDGGDIEVAVTDCGRGIAPSLMPFIFESFYTTKRGGIGLGLSISRSIISTHQGRIWAENNPGGGATFYFTVPPAQRDIGHKTAATDGRAAS